LLAEGFGELLREDAGELVGCAAGGVGHDQPHRLRRVALRQRAGADHQHCEKACEPEQHRGFLLEAD
jgi:hypothetical protein